MKRNITADQYQKEVLECELPVLVEFYAKWCSKCAMMDEVVEELAQEYEGIFQVCQIETGESPELAEQFEAEIVPTFVVFRKGKAVAAARGLLSREALADLVLSENQM